MRGLRSLLVLLVIALPLGWYAYRESKRSRSATSQAGQALHRRGRQDRGVDDQVRNRGAHDGCRRPANGRSSAAWPRLPTTASSPASPRTWPPSRSSGSSTNTRPTYKQYGLDPARVDVAFKAGGQEQHLLIGQKTPTGTDLYARLADKPRVFLISSYLDTSFNRTTFDLRDKTVLKIDREKVDNVSIATPDRTLSFTKSGSDWRMTAPVDARADFGAIEGIVGRLNTAQMKALTSPDGGDLKEYGLDKPGARCTSDRELAGRSGGWQDRG